MSETQSPDADAMHRWLLDRAAEFLQVPRGDISAETPLTDHGLTSVTAVAFSSAIEEEYRVPFGLDDLWAADTIEGIVARLTTETE